MRVTLLDWLMEISHSFRYQRQTFHLAAFFVDKFMNLTPNVMVNEL